MHGFEVLEADGGVEFIEGLGEGGGRAEVVACGEDVACVEADSDAGFVVD